MQKFWLKWGSKLSPAAFGLAVLCFLMPFISLSCGGKALGTASGFDIVTNTAFDDLKEEQKEESSEMNCGWLVTVALILIILGGLAALIRRTWGTVAAAVIGAFGIVSLLSFRWLLNHQVAKVWEGAKEPSDMFAGLTTMAQAMLTVDYRYGFWLAIMFALVGVLGKVAWEKYRS